VPRKVHARVLLKIVEDEAGVQQEWIAVSDLLHRTGIEKKLAAIQQHLISAQRELEEGHTIIARDLVRWLTTGSNASFTVAS
jgi:hypothetical protein